MSRLDIIREKLNTKIWSTDIARTVTIKTINSSVVDDYGEVYSDYVESTSKAVPYNTYSFQRSFEQWGELNAGETDMVFPHDTSLTEGSLVIDGGVTYEVVSVGVFPFGNGSVATIARLKESLD